MTDNLGDYLKGLERASDQFIPREKFIYMRLDGRSFSRLTRGLRRNDPSMMGAMQATAAGVVGEFNFAISYCQSDEISLVMRPQTAKDGSQHLFGGKVAKLLSIVPAYAASMFQSTRAFDFKARVPCFDARLVACSEEDALKFLYWRFMDARKNAVSSIASEHFSPKALMVRNHEQRMAMLADIGIDVYRDAAFAFGTCFHRLNVMKETPIGGPVMRTIVNGQTHPNCTTLGEAVAFYQGLHHERESREAA